MLEISVMVLFATCILACVLSGHSLLLALLFGYCLFFGYGLKRNYSWQELLGFSWEGISTIRNILLTFILIGVITAMWRSSGTVAIIVYHAMDLISPDCMVLMTFLLCVLMSSLTGTAFGSAATMGVVCVTIANSMGISAAYSGGAVLAGVFYGDRCSPLSTSALLVSTLTKTDLFRNMEVMYRVSWLPLAVTCVLYYVLGLGMKPVGEMLDVGSIFQMTYDLSWPMFLPAVLVLVLSIKRADVKMTLIVSSLCSMILAHIYQGESWERIFYQCFWGYAPEAEDLARILSGGGISSMFNVFCIVCISSSFAGIFKGTGFLEPLSGFMAELRQRLSDFGCMLLVSILANGIACNQTLAIMLTHQLTALPLGAQHRGQHEIIELDLPRQDAYRQALMLEDSAVVIAPLIPWSIAGAVPLATVGAPVVSIYFAFFLFLLPGWHLLQSIRSRI